MILSAIFIISLHANRPSIAKPNTGLPQWAEQTLLAFSHVNISAIVGHSLTEVCGDEDYAA